MKIGRGSRVLFVAALFVLAPGCRKGSNAGRATAAPAASDRFADGKRLTVALGDWKNRWQNELPPPSCDAVLTQRDERELCAAAAAALVQVKERAAALDQSAGALDAAAELSRRAAAAAKKLRFRDMEYMGTQGLSLPGAPPSSASASAASPAPSGLRPAPPRPIPLPQTRQHATPSASGDAGAEAGVRRDDPFKPALRAYARLEVEALRYLAAFLELGPLGTRQLALGQLEKLWDESGGHPSHPLQQVVRQASLLESDPPFRARLKKLDAKSHLTPAASAR